MNHLSAILSRAVAILNGDQKPISPRCEDVLATASTTREIGKYSVLSQELTNWSYLELSPNESLNFTYSTITP